MASPVPPSALKKRNQTPRAGKNVKWTDNAKGGGGDDTAAVTASPDKASLTLEQQHLLEARQEKKKAQSRAELAKLKRWRAQRRVLLKDPGYQHFAAKCYKLHFDRWVSYSKYSVEIKWLIYYAWQDYAYNKKNKWYVKGRRTIYCNLKFPLM